MPKSLFMFCLEFLSEDVNIGAVCKHCRCLGQLSRLIFVVFLAFFQDEDSCSDCSNQDKPGTRLQSFVPEGTTHFPEVFQTSHLLFYERFRAYQDYILGESVLFFASFIFSLQVDCLTQSFRLPALGSEKVDLSGFINFSLLYALSILTVSDFLQLTARPLRSESSQLSSWRRSLSRLDGGQSGTLMCSRFWLR